MTLILMMFIYILQYLMPFVEREQYQISSSCKLHPDNHLFSDQEQHKIHVDINEWRCGYCKKSFRAEKFLDQHFDNRHYGLLNVVCGPWFLVHFVHTISCQVQSECSNLSNCLFHFMFTFALPVICMGLFGKFLKLSRKSKACLRG